MVETTHLVETDDETEFFLATMGARPVDYLERVGWLAHGIHCNKEDIHRLGVAGKQTDLAIFTLDDLRFSGAGDPLAALVLCGAHQADQVMVAGRWVVENGEMPGLDIAELKDAHNRLAARLTEQI